tara:strand:- start:762 stop:1046 length:285 start_codon:yes stop_codon:yes gene_type:complete
VIFKTFGKKSLLATEMTSDQNQGIQQPGPDQPVAPDSPCSSAQPTSGAQLESVVGTKVIEFEDLARCGNEVWIRNGGQLYRLQQTRQGKLILTK